MNGHAPDRAAFGAYTRQLATVVGEAVERGHTYEERWAMIHARMERWGQQVSLLVRDLQASLQHDLARHQALERTQERER